VCDLLLFFFFFFPLEPFLVASIKHLYHKGPPSHGMSIVEFNQPNHAKKAFRSLAFSKFKHLPLFLEWAPVNLFRHKPNLPAITPTKAKGTETAQETEKDMILLERKEDLIGPLEERTLFVKNLNFETKEEDVVKLAKKICTRFASAVRSMTITFKPSSDGTKKLSRGYGFLQFANREAAEECFRLMQGVNLDGHSLQLQFTQKKKKTTKEALTDEEIQSKKLLVRNLPFQVNKKRASRILWVLC